MMGQTAVAPLALACAQQVIEAPTRGFHVTDFVFAFADRLLHQATNFSGCPPRDFPQVE